MKTRPNSADPHPGHRHGRWQATLCAAAVALLLCSGVPVRADVIDDFEHGRKFMLWGIGGEVEYEFVGGEVKLSHETPDTWAVLLYKRLYELPEAQAVEFRVDWVSRNASDVVVSLGIQFTGKGNEERGYACYVNEDWVVFRKSYDGHDGDFIDQGVYLGTSSKTISLTFTREGGNLRIDVKVVLRDDPQHVLFSDSVIDHAGADAVTPGGSDPGPPPSGPVKAVVTGFGQPAPLLREVVLDNVVCSTAPAALSLGMQRKGAPEATLAWPGDNIVLTSDSVRGPWRPSPEPVVADGEWTCTVPLRDSTRYFRLVQGYNWFDSFDSVEEWQTASVVPGGTLRPAWSVAGGRGRISGTGTRNEDFVLRNGAGIWYRDCVSSVDIVDWGDAMDGAAFGILLRVKPDAELWYSDTAGLPEQRYAGLLTFKQADNPTESALAITGPAGAVLTEQRFSAVDPDKQYRLRFWAVGDQLTLELFDRDNLDTPIQTLQATDGRIPQGMDGLYGTKSAGGTYEVRIDDFRLTGATVY